MNIANRIRDIPNFPFIFQPNQRVSPSHTRTSVSHSTLPAVTRLSFIVHILHSLSQWLPSLPENNCTQQFEAERSGRPQLRHLAFLINLRLSQFLSRRSAAFHAHIESSLYLFHIHAPFLDLNQIALSQAFVLPSRHVGARE